MKLEDIKNLGEAQLQANLGKTMDNWESYFKTYRRWFVTVALVCLIIFLVLGMWTQLLITYLILHFHVLITENWWQLQNDKDRIR